MKCLPFIAVASLMLVSCAKQPARCTGDVVCTMMFAAVQVTVNSPDGKAIAPDEVYTRRKSTGEIIKPEQIPGDNGRFVVLDDNYQKKLAMQKDVFYLTLVRDGKKIVEEPFEIEADCCHIRKVDGKDEISIHYP
ncbi:MAG: hypothetical protein EOP49_12705 [Sphingobacteriales bacterium]|nr:MAG: hypothetical protein EOP49_12705 [Sphingobacteriales bacterium]